MFRSWLIIYNHDRFNYTSIPLYKVRKWLKCILNVNHKMLNLNEKKKKSNINLD